MAKRLTYALSAPLLALSLLALPACGHRSDSSSPPAIDVPAELRSLDDYALARNAYELLPLGSPERAALRERLQTYLIGYLDEALSKQEPELAVEALEQMVGMWVPSELRSPAANPELAAAARRIYDATAPTGDERPATLGLFVEQAFGTAEQREHAEKAFGQLRDWIERGRGFSPDPSFYDELERLLEDVSGVFPSPWLVDTLADLYLERFREAQKHQNRLGRGDPRAPFTPYLLARLYLRADRIEEGVEALDRLELDTASKTLRDMLADAADPNMRSPLALDQLEMEFEPTPDTELPPEILRQSWGIVDNLARRTLARFPDHAPADLARGRVLRAEGLFQAAIFQFERALAGKNRTTGHANLHRAYEELAELYQAVLEQTADRDPDEATEMLARIEDFHRRAAEVWPQRPVEPGLSIAWLTLAHAWFQAGQITQAEQLLERSLEIEPQPGALLLLGTIAMRRGEFDEASKWFARLDELPFEDQLARYDWEIRSAMQQGETDLLGGEREQAVAHLREALRSLDMLLSYPGLDDPLRVEFLTRRSRVHFWLGDNAAAMEDFREAKLLAPARLTVYATPLIFTVTHGQLDEAREIYEAALANDAVDEDLRVYFSLWMIDLAERLGQAPPEQAKQTLRDYVAGGHEPWPTKVARYGLGELDFDALIEAADDPRERSEAYFYEGLRRWRSGKHDAGIELMRKVLDANMMGDFEYEMAQSYVLWKELPATARAAEP